MPARALSQEEDAAASPPPEEEINPGPKSDHDDNDHDEDDDDSTADDVVIREPYYELLAIEIQGNDVTSSAIIRRELRVRAGEHLSASDPRFEESRYRVLSLGLFSDVRLRLKKGPKPGSVILVVRVKERGTIQLTDLFLGTSRAVDVWGGLGLADRNFLGRGITLEGAFVLGAVPEFNTGDLQQSYQVRFSMPLLAGKALELNTSFIYLDGNEFFRFTGSPDDADPANFLTTRYQRVGGTFGFGFDTGRYVRLYIDYRGEAVTGDIPPGAVLTHPDGGKEPINFGLANGTSVLSNVIVTMERDTRSDPALPERGSLLRLSAEASTSVLASDFDYLKLTAQYWKFVGLPWKHTLAFEIIGGFIFGEAPFFDRFFIGDLSDLVPNRVLGLNFSTQPSRNIFGTSISEKRYEDIAGRFSVEYIWPWFREGQFFYGGDFFFNVGLMFLTSASSLQLRDESFGDVIPLDLTLNAGLRMDTRIGVFRLSVGNLLGRLPY